MSKKDFVKETLKELERKRTISREEFQSLITFHPVDWWQCPFCYNSFVLVHFSDKKHKILRIKE